MDILSEPPFSLPEKFDAVDDAIDANAIIAEAIVENGLPVYGIHDESWIGQTTPKDMDQARMTIKQLYRDWSVEGLGERGPLYDSILDGLSAFLHHEPPSKRYLHRVLVPGAGLGRLVLEICAAGYTVEGSEVSYHQLLTSNYILNCTDDVNQHKLFPWALSFSNHLTRANQLQSVSIPDVNPATYLEASQTTLQSDSHYSDRLSMTAGDFKEVYKQSKYAASFYAVVTCFFIDTAPNLIEYIETIKHCLKEGGIWINVGPLQWHYENDGEPGSFELSNDEVKLLVEKLGFSIEEEHVAVDTVGYMQNPHDMLLNLYRPAYWVARKF